MTSVGDDKKDTKDWDGKVEETDGVRNLETPESSSSLIGNGVEAKTDNLINMEMGEDRNGSSDIRIKAAGGDIFEEEEEDETDSDYEFPEFHSHFKSICEVELGEQPQVSKRKQEFIIRDVFEEEIVKVESDEEEDDDDDEEIDKIGSGSGTSTSFTVHPNSLKTRRGDLPLYFLDPNDYDHDLVKQRHIYRAIRTYRQRQRKRLHSIAVTEENKKLREHLELIKAKMMEMSECGCDVNKNMDLSCLDVQIPETPPLPVFAKEKNLTSNIASSPDDVDKEQLTVDDHKLDNLKTHSPPPPPPSSSSSSSSSSVSAAGTLNAEYNMLQEKKVRENQPKIAEIVRKFNQYKNFELRGPNAPLLKLAAASKASPMSTPLPFPSNKAANDKVAGLSRFASSSSCVRFAQRIQSRPVLNHIPTLIVRHQQPTSTTQPPPALTALQQVFQAGRNNATKPPFALNGQVMVSSGPRRPYDTKNYLTPDLTSPLYEPTRTSMSKAEWQAMEGLPMRIQENVDEDTVGSGTSSVERKRYRMHLIQQRNRPVITSVDAAKQAPATTLRKPIIAQAQVTSDDGGKTMRVDKAFLEKYQDIICTNVDEEDLDK